MTQRILCVDDEPSVLDGLRRLFRNKFDIETAIGGDAGVKAVTERGPFAVVVSDQRMPGMDGITYLKKVRELAPDTVRIMLTGNAEQSTVVDAVNEGHVFRFLNKPCPPDALAKTLEAGMEQYRLITAERELLDQTLNGAVKVMTDLLALVDPDSFGRAQALRAAARELANLMALRDTWEIELGAMLSRIGTFTLPPEILAKTRESAFLNANESEMVASVATIGSDLLRNIPRLEGVAQIVRYQRKNFDGTGSPHDVVAGDALPIGARILRPLAELLEIEARGKSRGEALSLLAKRAHNYDPRVMNALERWCIPAADVAEEKGGSRNVNFEDLRIGQTVLSPVVTIGGDLLLSPGRVLSDSLLQKLRNYDRLKGIRNPITVTDPAAG
jgi:response regulator RpfG family c-di-GMP phosphodiesterase